MSTTATRRQDPPEAHHEPGWRRALDRVGIQNVSLLVALALLTAFIGSQEPGFFRTANLFNIASSVTLLGLVAIGETVVMLLSALDISIGSAAGIASVATALVFSASGNPLLGIVAGIAVGLAAGAVNAAIIVRGKINPVIATLATLSAYQGIALLLSDGRAVASQHPLFQALGSGRVFRVPIAVIVLAVFAIAVHVLLRYTDIGRNVYAIGGNPKAARLAGINIKRYLYGGYALAGFSAALAGIMLTSRTLSGQPLSGTQGLELEAITAAALGGTALTGGKGTIAGTVLAVLLLGVLTNGMILLRVPTFYQLVAKGLLLVIAVVIQQRRSGEVSTELVA